MKRAKKDAGVTSVDEFRDEFRGRVISLHWRQWEALGVPCTAGEEKRWVIDLEALIVSTYFLGRYDKRLLRVLASWMTENRAWINLSRVKRIGRAYVRKEKTLKLPLIPRSVFQRLKEKLKEGGEEENAEPLKVSEDTEGTYLFSEYETVFEGAPSEETGRPNVQRPCLLQLYFRGVFGVNARAEVLLYLLLKGEGNASEIAREAAFDQKIVYRVLERWARSGLVDKTGKKTYRVAPGRNLTRLMPLEEPPGYTNWVETFLHLGRIMNGLGTAALVQDPEVLASFFRDNLERHKALASLVDAAVTDGGVVEPAEYVGRFASETLEILRRL